MAHVLIMPRQGNTVESCILVHWRMAEGAKVAADDVVCEVETDKASFEVPAGAAGVLLKRLRAEGDDVPVLEPIAVIGASGEDWSKALEPGAGADGAKASAVAPSEPAAPSASSGAPPAAPSAAVASASQGGEPARPERGVSPRARHLAVAEGVALDGLTGTGPHARVIERDVKAALAARPPMTAAARAAAATGAVAAKAGGAIGGRAGIADMAAPAAVAHAAAAPAPRREKAGAGDAYTETPIKSIRKIIAERMRASLATTAQLTFNATAPASRISALRARFKASDPALGFKDVTIGDLVLYAVSRVVPRFPSVNSHLVGTTLRTFERVHLGLAVDTPRGLFVPVIRGADLLSLQEISAEAKRLAGACQAGTITPDDLTGATFTVSNLGAFGVESFTPVLNAPEVGILGVCSVVQRPAVGPDGQPTVEPRMGLSLTVDHQIVDGAPAARILKAFCDAVGEIDLLLMK